MPLAIGGTPATAKPSHGTLWVDVRDYGAKADNGVTDNSVPFQAAVDDLKTRLRGSSGTKGVVFIPSSPQSYLLNKSVWVDDDAIEIQGEGLGTHVQMNVHFKMPVFIFGVARVQGYTSNGAFVPQVVDSTYRPDLYGKLDTSAVPYPATKWGIRTNGNSFAQFQAGPLSSGVGAAVNPYYADNWSETSKLTVEFCVEPPDGQLFPVGAPLFGIGKVPNDVAPFTVSIWDDPNKVLVVFKTADMDAGQNNEFRNFSFSLVGAKAPYRIAIQFDLDNAACTAYVNGVQAAVGDQFNLSPTSAYPFAPNKGLKFAANDHYPFMIGATGIVGLYGQPTGVDLRVYGLRLSNTIRYQNNGAGQKQVRADSPATPINDAYAYFGIDSKTVCFLAGTDRPSTSGRVVSVQHGNVAVTDGVSMGLIMHSLAVPPPCTSNAIRNIQIEGPGSWGQAVSIGYVYQFTVENAKIFSAFHAIGSFNITTNYFIYLKNCTLGGSDSGYYGALQLIDAESVNFSTSGRATIRLVGSSANLRSVFVSGWDPVCECVFKARSEAAGGNFSISSMFIDFEGYEASLAGIYCEGHSTVPSTSLVLKDIYFGTIGLKSSLVMLKDAFPAGTAVANCWLSAENLQAFTNQYRGAIDVDGPLWHGEVKGVALVGPRLYHRQRWGAKTNVLVREVKYMAPPRELPWYQGAHSLEVRTPADAQFAEWRCVGSGTYGTQSPPSWVGLNPVSVTAYGLAAYVLNHCYIKAAVN